VNEARFHAARRASVRAALGALTLLAAVGPSPAGTSGRAPAQQKERAGRLDQVFVRRKEGVVAREQGLVQKNELQQVVLEHAGKTINIDSANVVRISFGEVPPAYAEGLSAFERGDWSASAAKLLLAAGDASVREVVRAEARWLAAQALLSAGAADPTLLPEAAAAASGLVSDFPLHRNVPQARALAARALLLAGKYPESAAQYRSIFAELQGEKLTPGYERGFCLEAGLAAARAMLMGGDTLAGREIYQSLSATLGTALAAATADDPQRPALQRLLDEATLGEGFAELAAKNVRPALNFFQNKVKAFTPETSEGLRLAALLGLGEALLSDGKAVEARWILAEVSALEYRDRDRTAQAMLRLAECALKTAEPASRESARAWLSAIDKSFGDTPWATPAREQLKKLS
jgi:hypothetical protein